MPLNPEQQAQLTARRGRAAARINDPGKRQRFVSAQGDLEDRIRRKKVKPEDADAEYARLGREADDTEATAGMNVDMNLPSYKKGTKFVPKTGPAMLHRGEKVTPASKNRPIKHPGSLRKAVSMCR